MNNDTVRDGSVRRSVGSGKSYMISNLIYPKIDNIIIDEAIRRSINGGRTIVTIGDRVTILELPKSSKSVNKCELELEYDNGVTELVEDSHVVLITE